MGLFQLLLEIGRVLDGGEIIPARNRIESHAVEIGDHDLVAGARQSLRCSRRHSAAEALLFGMGVDDEDAHQLLGSISLPRSSASCVASVRCSLLPTWRAIAGP